MQEFKEICKIIDILKNWRRWKYYFFKFYYKIRYNIHDVSADFVVANCNSSVCDNLQVYLLLRLYLLKCGETCWYIKKAEKFNEIVKAKFLGNILVVSTSHQPKIDSFILFIDVENDKVICREVNLGAGIISLRLLKVPKKCDYKFLEVTYLKMYGTGFIVRNVRIYMISNRSVFSVFDKGIYELVSGWKAFEEDEFVEFSVKYELIWDEDIPHLRASGYVNVADKIRQLPTELYVYDELTRKFVQMEGRETSGLLLSEIYGDLATPSGNWFHKPKELNQKYSLYEEW